MIDWPGEAGLAREPAQRLEPRVCDLRCKPPQGFVFGRESPGGRRSGRCLGLLREVAGDEFTEQDAGFEGSADILQTTGAELGSIGEFGERTRSRNVRT